MKESEVASKSLISADQRQRLLGHNGLAVWFTGLSGSGKSTLACHAEYRLFQNGIWVYWLDADNLRQGINNNLGFSAEDRIENVRRIAEIAKILTEAGCVVLVSSISPFQKSRDVARNIVGSDKFIEIFVECPLVECERRDPKGLYKKARAGTLPQFTGISSPYEVPLNPDLRIHTAENSLEQCLTEILDAIMNKIKLIDESNGSINI